MRLRSSLILLVVGTIVPLVALAVVLSILLVRHQNENFVTATKDRNRAFMSAVDNELRGTIMTLEALAASRSLEKDDLAAFYRDAVAVHKTQPRWFNILLNTADGRQVMNAFVPWGTALPAVPQASDTLQAVVETGKPVVGNVTLAP